MCGVPNKLEKLTTLPHVSVGLLIIKDGFHRPRAYIIVRLNTSRKVVKTGDCFNGRKIKIPLSEMLHSRVPCTCTDGPGTALEFLSESVETSSGLVAAHPHIQESL